MTTSSRPVRQDLASPLQQHPQYGDAIRRLGGHADWIIWQDRGRAIAQAQRLTRRVGPVTVSWIARGPVSLNTEATVSLNSLLLNDKTLLPLLIAAEQPGDTRGYMPLFTSQFVAELNLSRTTEQRLGRQHGKWRNRLRKAQSSAQSGSLSIQHTTFDPKRDQDLLRLEAAQRKTRNYRTLPLAFLSAWAANEPDKTLLITAHLDKRLAAFMIILLHPPVATYHIGWSGPAGRAQSAHHLLLWEASNRLAAQGYTRFDLGSLCTDTAPGLARFKIGTGADIRQLGPTCLALPRLFRQSLPSKRAFPLANRATPR